MQQLDEIPGLAEWNSIANDPPESFFHKTFEAVAARTPHAPAVSCEGLCLTYAQLNERANQLAHHLRTLGVGPDAIVGVCLEKSAELVIAFLAILKAGAAYLPLEPTYPPARLSFMLNDAQVRVLCTHQALAARLALEHQAHTIYLDTQAEQIARGSAANPAVAELSLSNLAYVIYTSGSTGQPKGSLLEHGGLAHLVRAQQQAYAIRAESRVLQFSSISFDASLYEIVQALWSGATLVLAEQERTLPGANLAKLLREEAITHLTIPPSALARLTPQDFPDLQQIIVAGEACPAELVASWAKGRQFINAYGPTETTSWATWMSCQDTTRRPPIGRPIHHTEVYLLSNELQPVDNGDTGELYIGGASLGRGYLHRPDLTAERFIPHPYSSRPGARLYRTGDLARYLPDSNLEFIGRVDQQVKLRGFRIELGEIEAVLEQHAGVRKAVAMVREDVPGDRRLVAYVVAGNGVEINTVDLRRQAQARLPDFMVPAAYVLLEALPLTVNNKVDRGSLPMPDQVRPELNNTHAAPRDTVELQLVQLWESILNVRPIGVMDSFYELGGHSLLLTQVMVNVHDTFQTEVAVYDFYENPTIENLAASIRQGLSQHRHSMLHTSLVCIRPFGSKPPLFCIHPGGGQVLCYADLARHLDRDRPLYGLQSRGLNEEAEMDFRVEDMAAHYIDALRSVQTNGPYLLAGWSFGGLVAFEMARQLQALGQRVSTVAVLDNHAPLGGKEPVDCDDATLMARFIWDFKGSVELNLLHQKLRSLDPEEQLRYFLEQAKAAQQVPLFNGPEFMRRLFDVFKNNFRAAQEYKPPPSPVRLTLFRARDQFEEDAQDPTLGWDKLTGSIDVHEIPGNHYEILKEPHVQTLTEVLSNSLDHSADTNSMS